MTKYIYYKHLGEYLKSTRQDAIDFVNAHRGVSHVDDPTPYGAIGVGRRTGEKYFIHFDTRDFGADWEMDLIIDDLENY